MTQRALVLALLLCAGAAGAQPAEAGGGTTLQVPETVGEFRRTAIREANPGHVARFESKPGRYVDAYFYAFPRSEACGTSCDSVAIEEETGALAQLIPLLLERKMYDRLAIASDSAVHLPAGRRAWRGRHVTMEGVQEGAGVVSQYYLVSAGGYLMKLRATYRPDPAVDAEIAAFLLALSRTMAEQGPECPAGEATGERFGISNDVALAPAEVLRTVREQLATLGYDLQTTPDATEVVTFTRWTWPEGESDALRSGEHPGLRVRARVEPREGGSRVTVTAAAVCRIAGQDDARHRSLELLTAAEVTAGLAKVWEP